MVCARRQLQGWGGGAKAGLQEVRERVTSPEIVQRESQVVKPLHLLGVVSDSLCRSGRSSWLEKVPPGGGGWQRDLRIQTEASICGSQAWEGREMNFVADHHCEAVRDDIGCDLREHRLEKIALKYLNIVFL